MVPIRFVFILFAFSVPPHVASQEARIDELNSKYASQLCVHYLDSYLSLNQEQHVALEKLLERRSWTSSEISHSLMIFWSGFDSNEKVFDTLKPADLESILSDEQRQQLESLPAQSLSKSEQRDYFLGRTKSSVDPIKATLDRASVLEVQRLKKDLALNDDQARVLRVAVKGAVKKILAARQEFRKSLIDGDRDLAMARGFDFDRIAVEGPVFRIQEMDFWNSTLKNELSEEQHKLHLKNQTAKSMQSTKVGAHMLTMSYFHKRDISLDEYRNFTSLIEDGIAEVREDSGVRHESSLVFEVVEVFMNLDDERIRKSISPDTWNVIKPILNRLRKRNEIRQDD